MTHKNLLLLFSAISTALILGWILNYSRYGIDFTDEGFYLVWMANPFLYDFSTTQFGFIYHPLYVMLNGDISSLRQTNIIITFSLSWVLVNFLLKSLAPEESTHKITNIIVAAGFAVASLIVFSRWLPTPSYNSLSLQALLVTSIGLLLAEKSPNKKSILGWVLIGIGGWLVFMAKPSTALALTIAVSLYLILARKLSLRMIFIAIACALLFLLMSAFIIDGSISGFIQRLQTGILFASYVGAGHTLEEIIRIDEFQLNIREKKSMLTIAILTFIAMLSLLSEKIYYRAIAIIISMFFLGVSFSIIFEIDQEAAKFSKYQGLMIWSVVYPAVILGLVPTRQKVFSYIQPSHWAIALIFFAMPFIYSFGSNSNYWIAGGFAAIFWLLAGVVLLGPVARIKKSWGFALPLTLATQAISATLLQTGLEKPYRQPQPLRLHDQRFEFGAPGSNLILSKGYADYLNAARSAAKFAGLNSDTPVIDITGQSPGILYALRAENTGQPWFTGGYPGSLKRATAALSLASCKKLSESWILVEPDGPRSISNDLLPTFGSNLDENYTQVASWMTARGAGGYSKSREQLLYKPIHKIKIFNACNNLRK